MTGGTLNLSLLSRGVGEVQKNGHEKVDVYLEPEDYYNFSTSTDRFYLPPIHSNYPSFIDAGPSLTTRSSREACEFRVPKTFTTRKGALLLFSEDLAQRNTERESKHRGATTAAHHHGSSITPASSSDSQVNLKTVEDLANSILKYGADDRPDDQVYLKFVHARRENFERQIRPGFSAKRYLSTWTRTWDDRVFDNIIKHGYITERSLYNYNLVVPSLRRRLFYEDLSQMPQPYRLMRNMLLTPGSMSGYTFYRVPPPEMVAEEEHEGDTIKLRKRSENLRNIRVIKTQGGIQEEVAYSDLDRQSQKDVITDLLVKSAVHYALKKQEEIYEETIIRAVESEQRGGVLVEPEGRRQSSAAHEFDMRDAVESLLDSQHGRLAIGADLPEIDDRSHSSDMGGSFKGGAIPNRLAKHHQASHRGSWPADLAENDKEYMGGIPVAAVKDGSDSTSQHSSVPVLPPIRPTLSPIKDVSRETTQHQISLPPITRDDGSTAEPPTVFVQPATPQHSVLTGASMSGGVTCDANATRGLISRDADALPELEEEEHEADTGTEADKMSKKPEEISGSSEHSSEKDKGKTFASDGAAGDSGVHPATGSTIGTGTTGTARSQARPSWKFRKGPPTEEFGIMFRPPPAPKPMTGLAGLHGHTPLSSSSHEHDHESVLTSHASHSSSKETLLFDRDGGPIRGKRKAGKAGSQAESVKGSMIMAPDGEIISMGGSLARGGGQTHDVGNISDVMQHHRAEGAGTDESGASDDEPEEWRSPKKLSISQKSDINKKPYKRGSAAGSSTSVSKEDLEKLSLTGRYILWDQATKVSGEIDYTSGDIDATMSIYSWSYAAREHDHDAVAGVRSLPGLQLDGGAKDSTSDDVNDDQQSTESSHGEHWARITERPEEEEIANIESREVTQDEIQIPRVPSPSPASEGTPGVIQEEDSKEGEPEENSGDSEGQKAQSTPKSRSIALQTESEGSRRDGKVDTPRTSRTPRRSEFDADDEAEAEEEENDGDWPGGERDTHLDAVEEESQEIAPSRRESVLSKKDPSRAGSTSKAPLVQKTDSKAPSAMGESVSKSPTKSAAPSRTSDPKSARKGDETVPTSATESRAEKGVKSSATSGDKSEGRKSTAASKGGKSAASDRGKAKSISEKSKSRTGTVSVDKSQPSASTRGGRDTAESKSPVKSVSKEGEKSGRSSMKSKGADSQTKSRATTGGRVSGVKLKTPQPDKDQLEAEIEAVANPWDDDYIDDEQGEDEQEADGPREDIEDTEDYRMPSTPSEDNAKVSGEDMRGGGLDLAIHGEQLLTPPQTPSPGGKKKISEPERDSASQKSSITEKDIMDTLTDHAQRIAESVLSHPAAGADLEEDVKRAADLWMEQHPPRPLSRAHSVREFRDEAIAEIMRNRRASSAAPSAAEYRSLIKKSLAAAAAKAAGIDPDSISDDAEISPELLEALASHKLTPDQLEIVSDSEGRTRIQSRVDLNEVMGGVHDGHLYIAPGKRGEEGIGKRQISIPADKVSVMDDVEFDRISYQGTDVMSEKGEKGRGKSKAGSKAGSIAGGTMADLAEVEGMMATIEGKIEDAEQEDDFMKAVQQAKGQDKPPSEPPTLPDQGLVDKKPDDAKSTKSSKTGVSQKSEASKDSKKKGKKSPEEKEEPFVVGKVDQKGELEKLYGPVELPTPKQEEKAPSTEPKLPTTTTTAQGDGGSTGAGAAAAGNASTTAAAVAAAPATAAPAAEDGVVDHMNELSKLYGGKLPATGGPPTKQGSAEGKPKEKKPKKESLAPKKEDKKKTKGKKGKKGKKKDEEEPPPAPVEPPEPAPAPTPKEPTPRLPSPTPVSSEAKPSSPEFKTDESDLEFNFVREQSSPELESTTRTKINIPSPPLDEEDKSDAENEEDGGDTNLKSISNREARAAKRAAAAAKRREEVERRRREKEEQAKREKEEVERQVALQREMEEERQRREEERRLHKQMQKEAEEKEKNEKEEAERRQRTEAEREKRAKEEYQRKLEEMKRKQHEEEQRKHELMLQRQREEEERRAAEELLLSQMAEAERLEFERKRKEEEEERKRKEMEEKLRRAEEARKAMEEAQRLAEEMARKQAELEARLKFNRALQEESSQLSHSQEINRAFVFSYFELLQWLGLDIPEFELAKLADY